MSGPMKMYGMRQIVRHDVPVKLPTCMYQLNNIHNGDETNTKNGNADAACDVVSARSCNRPPATSVELITEQVKQFLKINQMPTAMGTLQQRQEVILQQLEALGKQMTSIRNTLKSNTAPTSTAIPQSVKQKGCNNNHNSKAEGNIINVKNMPAEISLNANPNNPPYSLILLQNHWRNSININIQHHTHSTVTILPEGTQQFMRLVEKRQEVSESKPMPTITIRLIWKLIGVNQLELTGPRPIQGEVNLLRYMARITSSLNYNEDDYEVDSFLDACYKICRSKNKTERIPLLQRLNKKLGKNCYIFKEFSIVDMAAYSAIKQNANENEINVNLTKWMKNCEAI